MDQSIEEQILGGIFIAGWLIVWPFLVLWKLLRWFVVATTKEAGYWIVKTVGGTIGMAVVAYALYMLTNHTT